MSLSGSEILGGMIFTGGNGALGSDGFLGEDLKKWMNENLGYVQLLMAVLVVVVIWLLWRNSEGFGEGGKNVERQTMDQSYFVPPTEYSPAMLASMRRENMTARGSEGDASHGAQAVAGGGSGVTSLADLMDQQARAKFLVDNECNKRGLPYMGDPWGWMVNAAREGYMNVPREDLKPGFRVSEAALTVPACAEGQCPFPTS
jgi:hypothetical protein